MSKISVVVIDDDPNITKLIADLAEMSNTTVVGIGHTGNHALRLAKEKNPDVIFLDVQMPEKNGVEALEEIKKISPAIKVVMVTGDKREKLKEELISKNADFIIYKPFDNSQIFQALTGIYSHTSKVAKT